MEWVRIQIERMAIEWNTLRVPRIKRFGTYQRNKTTTVFIKIIKCPVEYPILFTIISMGFFL